MRLFEGECSKFQNFIIYSYFLFFYLLYKIWNILYLKYGQVSDTFCWKWKTFEWNRNRAIWGLFVQSYVMGNNLKLMTQIYTKKDETRVNTSNVHILWITWKFKAIMFSLCLFHDVKNTKCELYTAARIFDIMRERKTSSIILGWNFECFILFPYKSCYSTNYIGCIVSTPPGCRGAGDFRKFSVRGAEKFLVCKGGWKRAKNGKKLTKNKR